MKLIDTFIRHVTANGKVQKHSDGGGLFLHVTPTVIGHHAAITAPVAVGELLRGIYAHEGNFCISRALRLAPLVFVRGNELIRAEWAEIAFEVAEWHIPAERMKMQQIRIVPLSRQALVIFHELYEKSGKGRLVFPGSRAENDGPIQGRPAACPAANRLRHRRTYLARLPVNDVHTPE